MMKEDGLSAPAMIIMVSIFGAIGLNYAKQTTKGGDSSWYPAFIELQKNRVRTTGDSDHQYLNQLDAGPDPPSSYLNA